MSASETGAVPKGNSAPAPMQEDDGASSANTTAAAHDVAMEGTVKVGQVKWFHSRKGYGFIVPNDGGRDVFVHHTAIVHRGGFANLAEGEEVEYVLESDGKPKAARVSGIGGGPVRGDTGAARAAFSRNARGARGGRRRRSADDASSPPSAGGSGRGGGGGGSGSGSGRRGRGGRRSGGSPSASAAYYPTYPYGVAYPGMGYGAIYPPPFPPGGAYASAILQQYSQYGVSVAPVVQDGQVVGAFTVPPGAVLPQHAYPAVQSPPVHGAGSRDDAGSMQQHGRNTADYSTNGEIQGGV